jgi:hypothetical protein
VRRPLTKLQLLRAAVDRDEELAHAEADRAQLKSLQRENAALKARLAEHRPGARRAFEDVDTKALQPPSDEASS